MSALIEARVAELTGAALDWAVAIAEGEEYPQVYAGQVCVNRKGNFLATDFRPSTDWSQGGTLIEMHNVWLSPPCDDPDPEQPYGWDAEIYDEADNEVIGHSIGSPTALVAVCRAVVLAQLGETVSIPAELVQAVQP